MVVPLTGAICHADVFCWGWAHRNQQGSCFKYSFWMCSVSPGESGGFPGEEWAPALLAAQALAERTGVLFAVGPQHHCLLLEQGSVTLPEQHPGFAEPVITLTLVSLTSSSPGQPQKGDYRPCEVSGALSHCPLASEHKVLLYELFQQTNKKGQRKQFSVNPIFHWIGIKPLVFIPCCSTQVERETHLLLLNMENILFQVRFGKTLHLQ